MKSNVFVVVQEYGDGEIHSIKGVFSSYEKAERFTNKYYILDLFIYEFDINNPESIDI